jgi:hypothetical protein
MSDKKFYKRILKIAEKYNTRLADEEVRGIADTLLSLVAIADNNLTKPQ